MCSAERRETNEQKVRAAEGLMAVTARLLTALSARVEERTATSIQLLQSSFFL